MKIIIQFEAKDVAAQKYAGPGGELASSGSRTSRDRDPRYFGGIGSAEDADDASPASSFGGTSRGRNFQRGRDSGGSSTGTATTPKRRRGKKR